MTDINKQKFLAELAQLLTFMYEEDRQTALQLYGEMFDEATDEQSLLQALVSPIRQAVLVARAYNATERRLSVHSQSREEAPAATEEKPEFIRKIYEIRAAALSTQPEYVPEDENQFSLFDEVNGAIAPSIVIPDEEFLEVSVEESPEAPAPAEEDAPEEPAAPADDAAEAEADDAPEAEEAAPAEAPAEPAEDEVDAFLADFTLPEEVAGPAPEEADEEEEAPAPELRAMPALAEEDEEEEDAERFTQETIRKPRILLLVPYIILAIPLTLIGIVLLLIPTLLSLGLAAGFLSAGVAAVSAAFSGFAVLADLFLVLGAALLLLAFGLLFLWLFIWFIGGAIVGLVRGVIELGGNWCFKEVPAL